MSWKALDRNPPVVDPGAEPVLDESCREKIRSFFGRYETKRAALLPALHVAQARLGHVPHAAMVEVAALLEIHPSEVLDVVSFYTHFSAHPHGRKTVLVCRSLSCELMGGKEVLEALKQELGVEEHGTTGDRRYTLMTEECLAACDYAPCLLINERMHKAVRPDQVKALLADADNATLAAPRSSLYDAPSSSAGAAEPQPALETPSDVPEMRDAD